MRAPCRADPPARAHAKDQRHALLGWPQSACSAFEANAANAPCSDEKAWSVQGRCGAAGPWVVDRRPPCHSEQAMGGDVDGLVAPMMAESIKLPEHVASKLLDTFRKASPSEPSELVSVQTLRQGRPPEPYLYCALVDARESLAIVFSPAHASLARLHADVVRRRANFGQPELGVQTGARGLEFHADVFSGEDFEGGVRHETANRLPERPTERSTDRPARRPTRWPTDRHRPPDRPTYRPTDRPIAWPPDRPTACPTVRPPARPPDRSTARPTDRPNSNAGRQPTSEQEGDRGQRRPPSARRSATTWRPRARPWRSAEPPACSARTTLRRPQRATSRSTSGPWIIRRLAVSCTRARGGAGSGLDIGHTAEGHHGMGASHCASPAVSSTIAGNHVSRRAGSSRQRPGPV